MNIILLFGLVISSFVSFLLDVVPD